MRSSAAKPGRVATHSIRLQVTSLREGGERLFLAALIVVVAALSIIPMGRLLLEAFAPGGNPGLAVLAAAFTDAATWRATWNTLQVGIGGMTVAVAVGTAFSILVALTDIRAKAPLVFCFMLPMMIPAQVTALSWIQLFEPGSVVLSLLGLKPEPGDLNPMYSRGGIILLLGLHAAPMVFVALRAGLRSLPREVVEAAQSSGARRRRILAQVVVPLMTPALVAGSALAFISSIGNFGIPALLGIPARVQVLPTLIYRKLFGFGTEVLGEIAAISLILAAMAFVGIFIQGWFLGRSDYRTTGASAPLLPFELGRARRATEGLCWAVIVVTLLLPTVALVATSLTPAFGIDLTVKNLVISNYHYVLIEDPDTLRSIVNSFSLAGGGAVLLVLLGTPFAYYLVWKPNWALRFVNFCAELPYAVPGTVVAIAAILVFLRPIPILEYTIYNTVWIILAAYLIRFMNRAFKPIIAGFHQVDRALEEAGQMSGAGLLFRMRTIILPLIAPAAMASMIIVFLAAFNELTVSALLWSAGSETIGVMIFNLKDAGDTLEASAMAVLTVIITVMLMIALDQARGQMPKGVVPWRD